jgi:hypothetical protein
VRRITEVVQNIEGLALDICLSGRNAALHISTAKGRVVIRLPRSEVVDKYITGHDSNGVPFLASESVMDRLVQDAEITAPKSHEAAPPARLVRRTSVQVNNGREAAWQELRGGSLEPVAKICERHGIVTGVLYRFLNEQHSAEWSLLLRRRQGKASHAELVKLGFPIPKPSSSQL